ncbi:sigma-E factor negative regulatory protein [Endozoicomonas sp. OPT23]|uniref:sigma-E factor negative regulatory protein n=1 Tax=Endozoicomonas sp. OPT23 TaxID=2072845 RepID=UPI0018910B32|nr:RseA family anti-sigma factor [Endozoicomonas sp. OPT23]
MSEKSSHNHAEERLRESLSAAMDGEASELEMRRVLDRLGNDDELRDTARRYQMAGDMIRHEATGFMSIDLSAGIREQLKDETVSTDTNHSTVSEKADSKVVTLFNRFWERTGQVAVAASVTFAVILGVKQYNAEPGAEYLADAGSQSTLYQPFQVKPGGYGASSIQAGYNSKQHSSISSEQLAQAQDVATRAIRERFRAYALQHAELSTMYSGQASLPFARLTTFETQ